jgi:hypothetical protein
MIDFKVKLKDSYRFLETVNFHRIQKVRAQKVLSQLEKNNSRKLDKKLIYLCNDYAKDVFGDLRYADWLYVYASVAREFRTGWIPENYYKEYVVKELKGLHGQISDLRSANRLIFDSKSFPDIGSYVNGLFLDEKGFFLPDIQISRKLFENDSTIVFKQDGSEQGLGIYFFTSSTFDLDKVRQLGNGVFQSYVKQHPELAMFSSKSVSTLRITTVSTDLAEIQVRTSDMRVGGVGATHVESTSFVRIPVDVNSGHYLMPAYNVDWSISTNNSYGGKDFEGRQFPKFIEACELVLELHRKIPFVRCIGWDVVVDEEGEVKILEWNGLNNGIKFGEATQGPCFADLGWEEIWRINRALQAK